MPVASENRLHRLVQRLKRKREQVDALKAERSRLEQILRETESAYSGLIETLPLHAFRKDPQGRFTFGSDRFCEELGLTPEDLTGKTDHDLFPPELAEKYRRDDERLLATGGLLRDLEEHPDGNAGIKYVEVRKMLLRDHEGRPLAVQGCYWDVTDWHRLNKQLDANRRSLELARQIQQGMLPSAAPELPGCEIAGRCYPADPVGGDSYDFVPWDDRSMGLVIGDACGHGLASSLLVTETQGMVRSLIPLASEPKWVLDRVNDLLAVRRRSGRFLTLLLARFDPVERRLDYASAGHVGFVLDPEGRLREELHATGWPIGLEHGYRYEGRSLTLNPGDMLVLVTDGAYEASDLGPRGQFGLTRMLHTIRQLRRQPPETIVEQLHARVCEHCRPERPHDDVTVLVVKIQK